MQHWVEVSVGKERNAVCTTVAWPTETQRDSGLREQLPPSSLLPASKDFDLILGKKKKKKRKFCLLEWQQKKSQKLIWKCLKQQNDSWVFSCTECQSQHRHCGGSCWAGTAYKPSQGWAPAAPGTAFFCSFCGFLHLNLGSSLGFALWQLLGGFATEPCLWSLTKCVVTDLKTQIHPTNDYSGCLEY